jgi:nucleoside-diphosphate-sugar epimerase
VTEPGTAAPVLVTGGTGFIGQRLVGRLRDSGHRVRVLALPDESLPRGWDSGVEVVRGTLSDAASVARAVQGAGLVYHLAAVVGDWAPEAVFRDVTVEGTRRVLAPAYSAGIPVVLASSIVVYGDRLGREPCAEDLPHGRPYGPYSRSKQAQERLAREYLERGADIRIVRPANVYGPGSRNWLDEVVRILMSGAPSLVSGGGQNAGLVYVDNVADILFRVGGPDAAAGDVFNACDEEAVTWARYFGDLAEIAGARAPRSVPGWVAWPLAGAMERIWRGLGKTERPALTREAIHLISADHQVPAGKARATLGHRPLVTYSSGLAACAADLEDRGLL